MKNNWICICLCIVRFLLYSSFVQNLVQNRCSFSLVIMETQSTKSFSPLTLLSCRMAGIWPLNRDGSPQTRIPCWTHCLQLSFLLSGLCLLIPGCLNDAEPGCWRWYSNIRRILIILLSSVRMYSILFYRHNLAIMLQRTLEWNNAVIATEILGTIFSLFFICSKSALCIYLNPDRISQTTVMDTCTEPCFLYHYVWVVRHRRCIHCNRLFPVMVVSSEFLIAIINSYYSLWNCSARACLVLFLCRLHLIGQS